MRILKLGKRRRVPADTVFFHQNGPRSVVAFSSEDADEIVAYLQRQGVEDANMLDPSRWRKNECSRRQQIELYARPTAKGEKHYPGKLQYDWEALLEWCAGTCANGGRCLGQPSGYAGSKNLASTNNYLFCYCAH